MYTYKDGKQVPLPIIETPETHEKCFIVSLPSTPEDVQNGKGEGIWACTTEEVHQEYDNHGTGLRFVKIVNKQSMYYPNLTFGAVIPVRLNGKDRPVALLEELQHHYGTSKKDEVVQFLENNAEI